MRHKCWKTVHTESSSRGNSLAESLTTENDEDRPCFVDRKSWQLFLGGPKAGQTYYLPIGGPHKNRRVIRDVYKFE